MFNQFISDMIHMTEGEKLIHYWPLWATIIAVAAIMIYFNNKRK